MYSVELVGRKFVIPRVCPNCMASPAEHGYTATSMKKSTITPTRLMMTFYYCDACDEMFKQVNAIRKKQFSYGPKLFALWFLMFVLFVIGMGLTVGNDGNDALVLIPLALAVGIGTYFTRRLGASRRAIWDEEKPPLPPNALGYDFAAFLTNMTGGMLLKNKATFSAARNEWLALLVQANPGTEA